MSDKKLSTDSYKGVRDFYPEDMAIQRYIFDTWSKTAESFGFERYDASILEPSDLYKAKGAENEEMVNEQTYTFIDRGEREVTLRPEMTPTVARMVAGKSRTLSFPVRWYSIPNLFRYERPQRGRLREHWQLNCDIFGSTEIASDVEIILLASQLIREFGANDEKFQIRINDRREMKDTYARFGVTDSSLQDAITRLNDRFYKISADEYKEALFEIVHDETIVENVYTLVCGSDTTDHNAVVDALLELGVQNVKIDRSIARGFNYYTGTIFEIFDVSGENNRAMLGGGRYDNLTEMFGGESISGIGFGMGDVTMRDFLETHKLLPADVLMTAPSVVIIPTDSAFSIACHKIASMMRADGQSVCIDYGTKKLGKKIADAAQKGAQFVMVVGEDEVSTQHFTLKELATGTETRGSLAQLLDVLD